MRAVAFRLVLRGARGRGTPCLRLCRVPLERAGLSEEGGDAWLEEVTEGLGLGRSYGKGDMILEAGL